MNQITISGRLGRDPEVKKSTKSGKPYTTLSVGVKRGYKEEDPTDWFKVFVGGNAAEAIAKNMKKGGRIVVTGKMTVNTYEKDGKTLYDHTIMADDFVICDFASEKKEEEKKDEESDLPFEF